MAPIDSSQFSVLSSQPRTKNQELRTLFIVGPTASGKTALALDLARELGGEIICADSRTIYKGLDIATAKPSSEERELVPHWGLDLVEPDQVYSASDFKEYATKAIEDIRGRGKSPMIVGGTGLYVDGLLFDFSFGPPADAAEREKLEALSLEELQDLINERDIEMPENTKNKRYLVRALEQGGVNRQKSEPMDGATVIGMLPERDVLDARIQVRAGNMLVNGALDEAKKLFEHYGYDVPAAAAPFYKAFAPHFRDGATVEACLERFYLNDRQLSKRQIAWFKRNPHINWFESADEAREYVRKAIKS